MPFEGEVKKEWQRNYNAKKKALKAAKSSIEKPVEVLSADDVRAVLDRATQMDAEFGGCRYKSEARSCVSLALTFSGVVQNSEDEADENSPLKPYRQKILGEVRTFEQWLDLRDKARKDLFWLGATVCNLFILPHVHQVVCDQFVKKNFDGVYSEGYTMQDVQDGFKYLNENYPKHTRPGYEKREQVALILDQRSGHKSTINILDAVQWFLNAPDCRVLVFTETHTLAKKFRKLFKAYFHLKKGAQPSTLLLLFPEYAIEGVDGTSKVDYECPAAKYSTGDPSLFCLSVDSASIGLHCDVFKMDDGISRENSNSSQLRENLRENINVTDELLDPWGFKDIIGTRYFGGKDPDYYGSLINLKNKGDISLRYFCRGCWIVKPGFEKLPIEQLTEDKVILSFPEKFGFGQLMTAYKKDESPGHRDFRNQKLNDPIDEAQEESPFVVTFSADALRAHVKDISWAPKDSDPGHRFVAVDWAYTAHKNSDWSVLVYGRTYQLPDGTWGVWILDVKYDKWTMTELAYQLVMFCKKHNPQQVFLEEVFGAEVLKGRIKEFADQYGTIPAVFRKPDSITGAKRNRIKQLEILLTADRLWFIRAAWNDETFKQFEDYKGEKSTKTRKDDVPDCISLLVDKFLPSNEKSKSQAAEQEILHQKSIREQMQRAIFGSQDVVRPVNQLPPDPRAQRGTAFGIPGLRTSTGDVR